MRIIYYSLFFVCFLFLGCNNNNSLINNPATANGEEVSEEDLPKFKFKTTKHDFGTVVDGETVSYTFEFKNVGKSNLIISGARPSCGCTVSDYPKEPIKPGETSYISLAFDSRGRIGNFSKNVKFVANTIPNTTVLYITGEVIRQNN